VDHGGRPGYARHTACCLAPVDNWPGPPLTGSPYELGPPVLACPCVAAARLHHPS
jgi:hypothetical protein